MGFRASGQLRFTRSFRLGVDYAEAALRERIEGTRTPSGSEKRRNRYTEKKVNLLIDIQAKLQAGKGSGYEH